MAARSYFSGGNTGRGYEHFLEELLPRGADARVCIVRGAMGTGTHLLLQRAAETWEHQGREVVRFYSGADETRLEAVISGETALADGAEPRLLAERPGAMILDLSAALDLNALRPWRREAADLHRRLRGLRARAWRCLHVAHTAWSDSAAIYAEALDAGSVYNLRMELNEWLDGAPGRSGRVFAQTVSPQGLVSRADSLLRPHTLCLDLPWGLDADALLYPAAVALRSRGMGVLTAMHPLDGGTLAHLCTETHAVVGFLAPGKETRAPKLDGAVLRRERDALAFNRAAYDLWLRQGTENLAAARACRDSLERLVGDAVRPEIWNELAEKALAFPEGIT